MRGALVAVLIFGAALASCAESDAPDTHLTALDLTPPEGESFDPNAIISIDELTDSSVDAATLRALLTHRAVDKSRRSPYGHDSFLNTYYSNGLSAVDALVNAAQQHRVNPLVLLVRAQMAQGLVALAEYPPHEAARVEYVFGCGCNAPSACDQALAGFDRQVDCLARQYRTIVDEMEANNGVTTGGWAKGREGRTIDTRVVTPSDAGTAVAYQFEPLVGDARRGNQLFWTIWKLYGASIRYQSPAPTPGQGRWIGAPCTSDAQCSAIPGGVCILYSGGMCSAPCDSGTCPPRADGTSSVCVDTGEHSYCFAPCDPNVPSSCRNESSEWGCCTVGTINKQSACIPAEGCPKP